MAEASDFLTGPQFISLSTHVDLRYEHFPEDSAVHVSSGRSAEAAFIVAGLIFVHRLRRILGGSFNWLGPDEVEQSVGLLLGSIGKVEKVLHG